MYLVIFFFFVATQAGMDAPSSSSSSVPEQPTDQAPAPTVQQQQQEEVTAKPPPLAVRLEIKLGDTNDTCDVNYLALLKQMHPSEAADALASLESHDSFMEGDSSLQQEQDSQNDINTSTNQDKSHSVELSDVSVDTSAELQAKPKKIKRKPPANRFAEMLAKIEASVYANHTTYSIGYDTDDSFIDDSEAVDVQQSQETDFGGFFVHVGEVKSKEKKKDTAAASSAPQEKEKKKDKDKDKEKDKSSKIKGVEEKKPKKKKQEEILPEKVEKVEKVTSQSPTKKLPDDVEQAIKELEEASKKCITPGAKRLPESLQPLFAKVNEVYKKSTEKKNITDDLLTRLAEFLPFQKTTIKIHLKKSFAKNEYDEYLSKLVAAEQKFEEDLAKLQIDVTRMVKEQQDSYAKNPTPLPVNTENPDEPPPTHPEFSWTITLKDRIVEVVNAGHSMVDFKNEYEEQHPKVMETEPKLSLTAQKKIVTQRVVDLWPSGWMTYQAFMKVYSNRKSALKEKEKKSLAKEDKGPEKEGAETKPAAAPKEGSTGEKIVKKAPKKEKDSPTNPKKEKEPKEKKEEKEKKEDNKEKKEKKRKDSSSKEEGTAKPSKKVKSENGETKPRKESPSSTLPSATSPTTLISF